MRIVGIDIGSRAIKLVVFDNGKTVFEQVADTTFDPLDVCKRLLVGIKYDRIAATGYGRHLFKQHWNDTEIVTEIKAAALGARAAYSQCRTIIDIGGQDTKAIALDENGNMLKFAMNDRCAAGTGRFLEVMATALSYTRTEFIKAAMKAKRAEKLSSMCTVFAESEVISLIARGAKREEVALGIHKSIVSRAATLLAGIPIEEDVLFVGGCALNTCLGPLLNNKLKRQVRIANGPQLIAAIGCALNIS